MAGSDFGPMNLYQIRALAGILLAATALHAVSAKARPTLHDLRALDEDHQLGSCIFVEASREFAKAAR
jgi:hypothetical protein